MLRAQALGRIVRGAGGQVRAFSPRSRGGVVDIRAVYGSRGGVVRSMSEEAKAQTAGEEEVTIFDKIVAGQIPCQKVYEDELALAFNDIAPQAPRHIVLIPKKREGMTQLSKATESNKPLLGHLMYVAGVIAEQEGLGEGWRLVVNDGKHGCQSVYHLHLHILGGKQLSWPPGTSV